MFYKCVRRKLANKSKLKEPNLLYWLVTLHSLDQVSKVKILKWLWCMVLLHELTLKIFSLNYHNIFGISWIMVSWPNKPGFLENFQENSHFTNFKQLNLIPKNEVNSHSKKMYLWRILEQTIKEMLRYNLVLFSLKYYY